MTLGSAKKYIYINSLIEKKKKEGREWKEEGKKGGRKEKNCHVENCKKEVTDRRPPTLYGGRDPYLLSLQESAWHTRRWGAGLGE